MRLPTVGRAWVKYEADPEAQSELRLTVFQGRLNCRTELCAEGLGSPAHMERWTKRRKEFPNGALTVTEVTERIRPSPQSNVYVKP